MNDSKSYIVTIDGPSGSGKGSLALAIARELGFNILDSGAIYRLVALKALQMGLDLHQQDAVVAVLDDFDIRFEVGEELSIPYLDGVDVSADIRLETTGEAASIVAAHAQLRSKLLTLQQSFFQPPGLVADGRDMGGVVFPHARFKFYLYASAEIRAQRRYKQLISMGISANIADLQADIVERDERDLNRKASPLKPAEDAIVVDSSYLDLTQVIELVLGHIRDEQ